MVRPGDWDDFPERIFGLTYSQHRVRRMKQAIIHYSSRWYGDYRRTKCQPMQELLELRRTITAAEYDEISRWFRLRRSGLPVLPPRTRADLDTLQLGSQWRIRPYLDPSELKPLDATPRQKRNRANGRVIVFEHNDEPMPQAPAPKGIECTICMEDMGQPEHADNPLPTVTAMCKHAQTTCHSCITGHVDSQIRDVPWDQIACPNCPEILDYEAVRTFASEEPFERYLRNSMMAAYKDSPNFMECLNPGCGNGQEHEDGHAYPIMTCNDPSCGFKSCFTHKARAHYTLIMVPWHEDMACSQYDEQQKERLAELAREEAASAAYLEKKSKICPNPSCGVHGTKISGCDHMTCRRCKYEYCWLCMASYVAIRKEGNSAHAGNCKYHTNRLA